jgi:hypothetical protein
VPAPLSATAAEAAADRPVLGAALQLYLEYRESVAYPGPLRQLAAEISHTSLTRGHLSLMLDYRLKVFSPEEGPTTRAAVVQEAFR